MTPDNTRKIFYISDLHLFHENLIHPRDEFLMKDNMKLMSIQQWLRKMTGWQSVETYAFAIHKEAGNSLSQIRKEYMDNQEY